VVAALLGLDGDKETLAAIVPECVKMVFQLRLGFSGFAYCL
jgi:hypothetical protein